MPKNLNTVKDLVDHLTKLGLERNLIVNDDGNTYNVVKDDFTLWDENIDDSPVSLNINLCYENIINE